MVMDILNGHGTASSGVGGGRLVYVIEDEPHIMEAVRYILQRDGWEVRGYASAALAFEAIVAQEPELLVLDVQLAGDNGLDLLRDLRERGLARQVPVLILSAHGHFAEAAQGLAQGAQRFMSKPFDNNDLRQAVRALGAGAQGPQGAGSS
jgi:DNA-binding response OmpR family regulator